MIFQFDTRIKESMFTIKNLIMIALLGVFISGCSGNYKSSDERYRPIGEPPIATDNSSNQR